MPVKLAIKIDGITYKYKSRQLIEELESIIASANGNFKFEVETEIVPIEGTSNSYLSDDTESDGDDGIEPGLTSGGGEIIDETNYANIRQNKINNRSKCRPSPICTSRNEDMEMISPEPKLKKVKIEFPKTPHNSRTEVRSESYSEMLEETKEDY